MSRPKKNTSNISGKRPQSLSAMVDIVPDAKTSWDYLTRRLTKIASGFGYVRVEPSILEDYAIYENLDLEEGTVVNFPDPEGSRVAVRAETLPGVMRAFSEYKFPEGVNLAKWFYISQVLSYSEAQKKFLNSWEYGFELFGELSSLNEVQLISLVWKFLKSAGLENLTLEINSIGKTEYRKDYEESLRGFLQTKKYELCNECVASIETYPLQVFRCKNLGCKAVAAEAPQIVDFLNDECRKDFTMVLEGLDELGILYNLNPTLVGKPGTSRVTFVVKSHDEQNEYFIGEGGYHEDFYESLLGKKAPCFGFVGYLDVLHQAIRSLPTEHEHKVEVFLVPLGDLASKKALRLFSELWDAQIAVHSHFGNSGVKNQLKLAEDSRAVIALIIGQKEAMDEMVILRDVKSGMQEVFQYERIIDEVKKRLGK